MAERDFSLVRPQVPVRSLRGPALVPALSGGDTVVGGIVKGLGSITEAIRSVYDGEDAVKQARVLGDAGIALTEAKGRVDQDADPSTYMQRWQDEERQIKEQAQEQIKSFQSPERQQHARVQLETLLTQHTIHAEHDRQQLSIDYQRAEGMRSLEGLARLGAQDPDSGGRDRWEQMGVGLAGDLRKTGAISPVEEVQWLGQFKNHLVANRLKFFSADLQNQLDD